MPVWPPDGTQIAYTKNGNIWKIYADGNGETQLTFIGGGYADWYTPKEPIP